MGCASRVSNKSKLTIQLAGKRLSHLFLILILLLHLALSLTYTTLIPLGEAPDEPAQLNYARFLANNLRLPATPAERQAADYRSSWPPLYHFLVAAPVALVGQAPPTRLKAVGDTPRRLIPTNGQTIASFIHTTDEAWPWRGLPLAWHLGRFVSVALTALAVVVTYMIAWQLTHRRSLATGAAALHAFMPQVLFIGSVVNDDNLLILLSGLILLALVKFGQRPARYGFQQVFYLGALLGLATVTKYNALPLWAVVALWGGWWAYKTYGLSWRALSSLLALAIPLVGGAVATGGWWFVFIWRHFNQVQTLGLIRGSLIAIVANTSDTSLRKLASGQAVTWPDLAWLEWIITIFQSFWGSFGGGGTIDYPNWVYWLLALFCLAAITAYIIGPAFRVLHRARPDTGNSLFTSPSPHFRINHLQFPILLILLTPVFFLPLPLVRFFLSGGDIVETAQGRHLFPALPAITFGLIWGLAHAPLPRAHFPAALRPSRNVQSSTSAVTGALFRLFQPVSLLPLFTLALSIYGLPLIRRSYPPPIPLSTVTGPATTENLVNIDLGDGITLVGYELASARDGLLPVTLIWQAAAVPKQDYLVKLTLTDPAGQPVGGWLGHPVGGRYPTRAWDKDDILRHQVLVPLLPGPDVEARLSLQLVDALNQSVGEPVMIRPKLPLPTAVTLPKSPNELRADGLSAVAPFTYRSTLSFVLPILTTGPTLVAPAGNRVSPTHFMANSQASIAHFIVEADWPSGDYHLKLEPVNSKWSGPAWAGKIENRPRQFQLPPIATAVKANFAGVITLLGYDLPQRRVEPGQSFPITLHWQAGKTMGQSLTVFNHLLDQTLTQRGGVDRIPLKYYSVLLWVPGEIVSDSYMVPVEATAPAGVYWLDVGLYPTNQPTLSLPLTQNGQPTAQNSVPIGPIKVGGPPPGIIRPAVKPYYPIYGTFGDQITLLGFNLADDAGNSIFLEPYIANDQAPDTKNQPRMMSLQPTGQVSPVTNLELFWQAETRPTADYTVFIHLLDPQNNIIAQFDGPPAAGVYPTSLWDPGEIIADGRALGGLPAGRYSLVVGLYRPDTGERLSLPEATEGTLQLLDLEINGPS